MVIQIICTIYYKLRNRYVIEIKEGIEKTTKN